MQLTRWAGAVAGMAMACAVNSQAAVDYTAFTFDTDANSWVINGWGGQATGSAWDGGQGSAAVGSLYVVDDFSLGDQLIDLGWFLPGGQWWSTVTMDLTGYSNITFRVFIDSTNSTISKSTWASTGETAWLWAIGAGNSWIDMAHFEIPDAASNGWVTVSVDITNTTPGLGTVNGLGFKKWTGTGYTGKFCFWVDDIKIFAAGAPPPPPVLTLDTKPVAGLHLFADGTGGRENIRSDSTLTEGFYSAGVVNYSFTIAQWNGTNNFDLQQHMFIVNTPTANSAADWENPQCIFMELDSDTNASALWTFRYKTNSPNNNAMFWDTNINWQVTDTTLIGKWTLTVSNDTTFFMTSPSGNTTSFTLDSATAFLLGSSAQVYYGVMAKSSASVGDSVVLSKVQIDSPTAGVTDVTNNFSTGLNPTMWNNISANPAAVVPVPPNATFVKGTTPWSGYYMQLGTNGLAASSFTTNGVPQAVQHGGTMYTLFTTADTNFTAYPLLFPKTSGTEFIIANKNPTQ